MPNKHGISHALATFICAITAPLFLHSLKDYLPLVHIVLTEVAKNLRGAFNIYYSVDVIASILFATLMAFFWGVGFYYMHK